jgi:hypothetical protein
MIRFRPLRYWLARGTEACAACIHQHVLQMGYRCAGCDRGVCEQCVVVVSETREAFCPECGGSNPEGR